MNLNPLTAIWNLICSLNTYANNYIESVGGKAAFWQVVSKAAGRAISITLLLLIIEGISNSERFG